MAVSHEPDQPSAFHQMAVEDCLVPASARVTRTALSAERGATVRVRAVSIPCADLHAGNKTLQRTLRAADALLHALVEGCVRGLGGSSSAAVEGGADGDKVAREVSVRVAAADAVVVQARRVVGGGRRCERCRREERKGGRGEHLRNETA